MLVLPLVVFVTYLSVAEGCWTGNGHRKPVCH